ncbi:hypothetical protein AMTRI_Chr03g43790 [Amborella trichopoda]|uniref:Uncharacterized protein n=1 Tax=Amborella trichopoda TaxID=13333 RepID=W1PTU6_AMBTC|nr:hypothetical protein AMTR_s00022p00096580 [Amborella trichopoda]
MKLRKLGRQQVLVWKLLKELTYFRFSKLKERRIHWEMANYNIRMHAKNEVKAMHFCRLMRMRTAALPVLKVSIGLRRIHWEMANFNIIMHAKNEVSAMHFCWLMRMRTAALADLKLCKLNSMLDMVHTCF